MNTLKDETTGMSAKSGFSIMEIIPALMLLLIVSIGSMDYLSADLSLRRKINQNKQLHESFKRVLSFLNDEEIVVLQHSGGSSDRKLMRLPHESWIPDGELPDGWIAWQMTIREQYPDFRVDYEYRIQNLGEWKWWVSSFKQPD